MSTKTEKEVKLADYIVAIGASAGGLEALQVFFSHMPLQTGIGFVVIQHLSPDYKSLMDELLARHTDLRICKVENGMPVEPDTIYLIPPRKNMTIFHGKLILEEQVQRNRVILPVDIFFRSLATDKEKKAIGVVLSGTGSDGTLGVRAIKGAGGMIMIQKESTAKFDGMPRSSIATGLSDFILAPEEMAEALINYVRHPFNEKPDAIQAFTSPGDSLAHVLHVLRDFSGIDFSFYKENTIVRRLERRLNINRIDSLEGYIHLLNNSEKEKDVLYRELLIGVTQFFRDEEAFDLLKKQVIPSMVGSGQKELRIWSAACSTGEEVYSLAMLIREYMEKEHLQLDVKIFATDIDKNAVATAGQGIYPESIVVDVDISLISKYFVKREVGYQVSENLRKMVIFASHNVLKDPPFSRLDMIVCRNLFIYFKPDSQNHVLNIFRIGLKPGGVLFLGSSETLGKSSEAFDVISNKHKIYRKKINSASGVQKLFPGNLRLVRSETQKVKQSSESLIANNEQFTNHLLSLVLPPSVIVDENLSIHQIINDINPYIKLRAGRFSHNLSNIVSPELAAVIHHMIRKMKGEKKPVRFEKVKMVRESGESFLHLEGKIVDEESGKYLIIFYEAEKVEDKSRAVINLEDQTQDQLKELQNELQYTKENLQATVEELETSNEELQASNEELMASNEELQSTNEELQSVNEELHTVNFEYQNKIDELLMLNNDINNLLNNTGVAALYLDKRLFVRKFTTSFAELFKLKDLDIGRDLKDLATAFIYEGFMEDVLKVQSKLRGLEHEVNIHNSSYLLRIAPYRTEYNAVDGVVITMVDICNLQKERQKLLVSNRRLQQALEVGNMAWWEWDVFSDQVTMHPRRAQMLGQNPETFTTDMKSFWLLIHPQDRDAVIQQINDHLAGKEDEINLTYRIATLNGEYHWFSDLGSIVERTMEGKPSKVIGITIDVNKLRNLQIASGEIS
jgi:two-component system, chemotaxis family, CheB/CheR fusion protein